MSSISPNTRNDLLLILIPHDLATIYPRLVSVVVANVWWGELMLGDL
ncbi:hypothetical protein A2U01_0017911 [Trifolium medium]|uniref:Uncharacterized protein n=1 Tax=Trifolium medium TaxID=97028 RepID=A0A392NAR6_9FABA|nr:hypothetical protein [Trifolium medium]